MRWTIRKWFRALPWMVLACTAVCCAMAIYTWRFEADVYRASASLYAMPEQNTTFAVHMLAADCSALVETEEFAHQISLEEDVSLELHTATDSHLLEIAAVGTDVQAVFETANRAANALQIALETTLQAQNTALVQLPQLPQKPIGPNRVGKLQWTALISFALCSLLGGCLGEDPRKMRFSDSSADAFRLGIMTDTRAERIRHQKKVRKNKANGTLLQHVDRFTCESARRCVLEMRRLFGEVNARAVALVPVRHNEENAAATLLMASEMAQQGYRVLLMDMDARHAMISRLLGVKTQADVADFLTQRAELDEVVIQTAQLRLSFMNWMHPETDLAELTGSDAFTRFLKSACGHFDYVLMHTPAVCESSDAALLALAADEAVLMVPDGTLTERAVLETADELRRCGKPALGVLFTGVKLWQLETEE